MSRTLRLSDETVRFLETEGKLFRRSAAAQAEYLISLGKVLEQSSNFDYQHIKNALAGAISPNDLSDEEMDVFHEEFDLAMESTTSEENAFYAGLSKRGRGVGENEDGTLVYQSKNNW